MLPQEVQPEGTVRTPLSKAQGHRLPINDVDLVPRFVVSNSNGDPPLRTRTL